MCGQPDWHASRPSPGQSCSGRRCGLAWRTGCRPGCVDCGCEGCKTVRGRRRCGSAVTHSSHSFGHPCHTHVVAAPAQEQVPEVGQVAAVQVAQDAVIGVHLHGGGGQAGGFRAALKRGWRTPVWRSVTPLSPCPLPPLPHACTLTISCCSMLQGRIPGWGGGVSGHAPWGAPVYCSTA